MLRIVKRQLFLGHPISQFSMQKHFFSWGWIMKNCCHFFYQLFPSDFRFFLKWKVYLGSAGKYPSPNKQCIQTSLETEHVIKFEFGVISWLVNLYACGKCFSGRSCFASYDMYNFKFRDTRNGNCFKTRNSKLCMSYFGRTNTPS